MRTRKLFGKRSEDVYETHDVSKMQMHLKKKFGRGPAMLVLYSGKLFGTRSSEHEHVHGGQSQYEERTRSQERIIHLHIQEQTMHTWSV